MAFLQWSLSLHFIFWIKQKEALSQMGSLYKSASVVKKLSSAVQRQTRNGSETDGVGHPKMVTWIVSTDLQSIDIDLTQH